MAEDSIMMVIIAPPVMRVNFKSSDDAWGDPFRESEKCAAAGK